MDTQLINAQKRIIWDTIREMPTAKAKRWVQEYYEDSVTAEAQAAAMAAYDYLSQQ